MHYKNLYIAFILIVLFSCDQETEMQIGPDQEVRYVIFSSYDPDCSTPDCSITFKIDNLKFFKDIQNGITNQQFPYRGRYVFFSASEQLVESFLNNIPNKLLNQNSHLIGDCTSCERIYLEIGFDDNVRYWVISQQDNSQPKYVRELVSQVQSTIAQLQNY